MSVGYGRRQPPEGHLIFSFVEVESVKNRPGMGKNGMFLKSASCWVAWTTIWLIFQIC